MTTRILPFSPTDFAKEPLKYTVRGLENLRVGFGPLATPGCVPLNFRVDPATGTNGTNFMDSYDLGTWAGRSLGACRA